MNYFSIERNERCWEEVFLKDNDEPIFMNYLMLTYDEMKDQDDLEDFILAVMEATNTVSEEETSQTIITLIGEDDVFIWSIVMGPNENGDINYFLVDWTKDGKKYRYES